MSSEPTTDLAVLERLVELSGQRVVDIGCGGGALVRELAARGADVIGVETSEEQLAEAIARDDGGRARYLVGRAEALPLEDQSVDVAVFMRSLHHVPPGSLALALSEASRVVRPGGNVYVAEPLARGDFFELTRLIEDEALVRELAQTALVNATAVGLESITRVDYDVRICIRDLAALRARLVSVDPVRGTTFDARRHELAEAFERLGVATANPGERCFLQPMRADVTLRRSRWSPDRGDRGRRRSSTP